MKFELKNFEKADTELSKKNKSFRALSQVIAHSFTIGGNTSQALSFIVYSRADHKLNGHCVSLSEQQP